MDRLYVYMIHVLSAKESLNLDVVSAETLRVVLEDDGTVLDSDEFLPYLDKSTFVVLCPGQSYDTRFIKGKFIL